MINTQLLENKIKESGLRYQYLEEQLGLSRNGFYLKRTGKIEFRKSEIYVLCDILNITSRAEKMAIFYPDYDAFLCSESTPIDVLVE